MATGFDMGGLIEGLKNYKPGGTGGEWGQAAAQGLEYGFMPRYTRATADTYRRGFTSRGTQLNRAYAPLDKELFSSAMSLMPDMYFKGQGLNLQQQDINLRRELGYDQLGLESDKFAEQKRKDKIPWYNKLFGNV